MKSSAPEESKLTLRPFFFAGAAGRVFCIFIGPPPEVPRRAGVLFVAPFAEEMNKSRRQVMLQARSLASVGYGVLLMDLFGTGDSEGDFANGRLEFWHRDLLDGAGWLEEAGFSALVVWGLRWGSLLAVEVFRDLGARSRRLVLWQPVLDGAQHIDQFIRLRVASSMLRGGAGVTVRDLRGTLAAGSTVEVAGYELHPALVDAIDCRKLSASPPASGSVVDWIEVVTGSDVGMGIASKLTISAWQQNGVDVRGAVVVGQQFWSTVEVCVAPTLIQYTTSSLSVPP